MRPTILIPPSDVPPQTEEKTSALLRNVISELPGEEVRIGHVVRQLRKRSFGGLFVILGLLGLVPGISVFAGLAMLIPAVQLILGFRAALLPRFVRERRVATATLQAAGERFIPWIEKLERFVRPRWLTMTLPPMPTVIGVLALGLAVVVALPIPFSNVLPAVALACLSLGFLERDGLMLVVGIVLALIALSVGAAMAYFAGEAVILVIEQRLGRP